MFRSLRVRSLLPFGVLALAALLGGCVAYPAYPSYSYDGYYGGYYGAPYYSGGVVAFGGGWGWHDHDRDWHWRDHDHDRGWRR